LKTLLVLFLTLNAVVRVNGETEAATPVATNSLSLDSIISEVLTNNPSLKAARASWEAMLERIPQASAWEDPRAGVDATVGRFVDVPQNSFADQKFMAEQTLPISGKNRWRGRAASAEAVDAYEQYHRRELDTIANTRIAYYRLANAYAQLDVNRKDSALLRQFAEISRVKYEAGTRSQADVLSAETEVAKLDENASDFERAISEAQTQLNTLMNRPPGTPFARPVVTPPTMIPAFSLEKLEGLAVSNRPELLMAEQQVRASQSRLEAARREWIPEPSVRAEADRYNGASQGISEFDLGFSINLPWFNRSKYKAAIRENQKLVESAEYQLAAIHAQTLGLLRDQFQKLETFHHHTELTHSKLLPLAEQTVLSKRLSYEADKADFFELLTAQQTVQEMESMYWEHLADFEISLAELEALVGTSLDSAITANEHQHHLK
jgi:cobalt-zinc-cadmium efflux system outer membrane protein